jgi:hypothetical protein
MGSIKRMVNPEKKPGKIILLLNKTSAKSSENCHSLNVAIHFKA